MTLVTNPKRDTFGYVGYSEGEDRIVVAFRGTNGADLENWLTNIDSWMQRNPLDETGRSSVHLGFFNAYKDISGEITEAVRSLKEEHKKATLMITGHSLGGALALLAALDIRHQIFTQDPSEISLYTFG